MVDGWKLEEVLSIWRERLAKDLFEFFLMVVIKPPRYQTPAGRSPGKICLGRAVCYFLVVVCGSYLADQAYLANKNGIRGAGEDLGVKVAEEPKQASSVSEGETAKTDTVPEPPPPPPPPAPPAPEVKAPEPVPASQDQGLFSKLCEREIGINLDDHSKWPTPFTPTYLDKVPESNEAVVFSDAGPFGNTLLVGLFHLLELGADRKCPVYLTKDTEWLWDMITLWFYGKDYVRNDEFWISMGACWGVVILENAAAADQLGKEKVHKIDSQGAFYFQGTFSPTMMRNLHDTVFRKLFKHARMEGDGVCSTIVLFGLNKADAKYTFIDIAVKDPWNQKFIDMTGRDMTAAFEMKPEYIKSILEPLQMLEHPVYVEKSLFGADPNREEVKRLIDDSELKTKEVAGVSNLFMAVCADVYIGNPASHWSLMVARMRYALGIKNSYVLMEKRGDKWTSYVDDTNYLELYDKKLGIWL
jgi:hypothetical protein